MTAKRGLAIDTHVCCDCNIEKDISNFTKNKSKNIGISYYCKDCGKIRRSKRIFKSLVDGNKVCTKCNIEKHITKFYRALNAKDGRASACKNCDNKRKVAKLHSCVKTRLKENCRKRLRDAMKGIAKCAKTFELIGCSTEELRLHLERQFKDNMTWENYGEWHIDHILPCSSFDLLNEEEQRKCFHYSNLQPLWKQENLRKADKLL